MIWCNLIWFHTQIPILREHISCFCLVRTHSSRYIAHSSQSSCFVRWYISLLLCIRLFASSRYIHCAKPALRFLLCAEKLTSATVELFALAQKTKPEEMAHQSNVAHGLKTRRAAAATQAQTKAKMAERRLCVLSRPGNRQQPPGKFLLVHMADANFRWRVHILIPAPTSRKYLHIYNALLSCVTLAILTLLARVSIAWHSIRTPSHLQPLVCSSLQCRTAGHSRSAQYWATSRSRGAAASHRAAAAAAVRTRGTSGKRRRMVCTTTTYGHRQDHAAAAPICDTEV